MITPGRQFRARQIEDAQERALWRRQGVLGRYTPKAERAESAKFDIGIGGKHVDTYEDEGLEFIKNSFAERRALRRTPFNPAKGLVDRFDPASGGPKEREKPLVRPPKIDWNAQ